MFYLFMFLWVVLGACFLIGAIMWTLGRIKKREGNGAKKFTLYSLGGSLLCFIIGLSISFNAANTASNNEIQNPTANESEVANASNSEQPVATDQTKDDQEVQVLFDATQFSNISPDDLKSIMGDPEWIDDGKFTSSNGNEYDVNIYIYDNGNKEFMIIDNKVVRFSLYGTGETYKSPKEALNMFGIEPDNLDFSVLMETDYALRYRGLSENAQEFWLLSDGTGKIDSVKISYDLNYF